MSLSKRIADYMAVRTADATTDAYMRDVIGRKTDTSNTTVGTTSSLMRYVKGLLNQMATNAALEAAKNGSPRVAFSAAATALANNAVIFTIAGGPIVIDYLASICIATGDGGAATLQYSADPTVGAAATISGATGSLATAVAGSMVVFIGTALVTAPTFLTTGHGVIATGPAKIAVNEGTITTTVGGAASTATWKHYLSYIPLSTGITVTA